MGIAPVLHNTNTIYELQPQLTAKTCWLESLYVGDGSYLDPVIDNSYSLAHAENHGVIPVDGVCGKAGYFNNSYMIAPRPPLADDITIYFWAKLSALAQTGHCDQDCRVDHQDMTVDIKSVHVLCKPLHCHRAVTKHARSPCLPLPIKSPIMSLPTLGRLPLAL